MVTARDADGRPSAWVTTLEPEFDANERDSWHALEELKAATCPQCGNLRAICSDPDGVHGEGFYPQRDVCWVTAAQDVATRRFRKLHEKAKPDAGGFLPTDGSLVWASPENLTPDDDFLAGSLAPQQSPRE